MIESNENWRRELLRMRDEDLRVREELAAGGELFDGYNPQMEAVHVRNARRLAEMLGENGGKWIGKSQVGEDAAEAAWLIVQHAIGSPELLRRALPLLCEAVENGEAPAWQAAFLEDRILFFSGKPQLYGTQFDWNERGEMSPNEIFEPEKIDERRAAAGLSVPYSDCIKSHNHAVKSGNEPAPPDLTKRQQDFEEWARKVGWR